MQAMLAISLLGALRINALLSLKIGDINFDKRVIIQDPRHVKTKFSKMIITPFFPVGDDVAEIVKLWVLELKELGYDNNGPLFPSNKPVYKDGMLEPKLSSEALRSQGVFNAALKDAFTRIGYFKPVSSHMVRYMISTLALSINLNAEEYKAYSAALGHKSTDTTYNVYGSFSQEKSIGLMKSINNKVSHGLVKGYDCS